MAACFPHYLGRLKNKSLLRKVVCEACFCVLCRKLPSQGCNASRQSENVRIANEILNATGQFFLGNYLTFSLLISSKLIYFNVS